MRYRGAASLICWTVGAALPLTLSGQALPDRNFLDSILAQAQAAITQAAVPLLPRCDGRDPDVVRICQAIIAVHHSPLAGRREEVFAAEDLALTAVFARDRWPYAWYALALVRLQLAHDKVLPHAGPAQPDGVSNELGGTNALTYALELDPTFAAAANTLALAAPPREGTDALVPRVLALRRVRQLLSATAVNSAATLEREAGSIDSAIALERRALASGEVDSGVVLLALARDLYHAGHFTDGQATLLRGAATTTDVGRNAYRAELAWVASPQELGEWDSVATPERTAWLAGFWSRRDVADGRPAGARLIEHYRRVEHAIGHFRIAAPKTDRAAPLTFFESNEYVPERLGRDYARQHADLCPGAARFASDATAYGADAPERYFRPAQDLLDDRAAIWIRHGPPTMRRQSNGDEAVEVWQYERAQGPLILQFRTAVFPGVTGVPVLVPSLLTISPGLRNQVCPVDPSICSRLGVSGPIQPGDTVLLRSPTDIGGWGERIPPFDPVTHRPVRVPAGTSARKQLAQIAERCREPIARVLERQIHEEGTLLGTAAIIKARDTGREQIDLATTTDTYHREFTRAVHPATQILGLDRAGGGAPRLVIAYAIPAEDVGDIKADSALPGVRYPVRVQVMAGHARGASRFDIDTLVSFGADRPLRRGQLITGLLEVPLPADTYAIGVVFTQSDGRGATVSARRVALPSTTARLTVSDIALGRSSSGVQWNSGATNVPLNPIGTYPKGEPAEIYFQLSGLNLGTRYQTNFEFFRADDDPKRGARLTVSFAQSAQQDRIEVSRTLGLQQLEPGKYRVKLTVTGGGAETSATGWLTISK